MGDIKVYSIEIWTHSGDDVYDRSTTSSKKYSYKSVLITPLNRVYSVTGPAMYLLATQTPTESKRKENKKLK